MTLIVIDLGISNVASVLRAFERIGAPAEAVTRPEELRDSGAIVLPGVGSFRDGMASLREKGLVEPLRRHVRDGGALLGVCLGMQLLADVGHEHGREDGLGLLRGEVVRLPDEPACRIPHIGWTELARTADTTLVPAALDGESVYFVHGYHLVPGDAGDIAATVRFGRRDVVAAVERQRLFGVQFHPEKSQDAGLEILAAFVAGIRTENDA